MCNSGVFRWGDRRKVEFLTCSTLDPRAASVPCQLEKFNIQNAVVNRRLFHTENFPSCSLHLSFISSFDDFFFHFTKCLFMMRFYSVGLLLLLGNLSPALGGSNVVDKRGLFSTVGVTTTTTSTPTASPTSVNESSLPSCGQTCFNAMLAQYSALGCATEEPACLCENVDFSNGLRDCSNGACGTAVGSTVIAFGSAYCASATFGQTPTTKPAATATSLDEASLPSCGQTCFNAMLAQYSALGCAAADSTCLCKNVDFSNGLRDCSNGACGTSVGSTVIAFGSAYCYAATATTMLTVASTTKSSSQSSSTTSSSSTVGSTSKSSTSKSTTLSLTTSVSHSVPSTSATHIGPITYDLEITSTFTAPPECTEKSFTQTIEYQDIWQNMINPVPSSTYMSCYPSQFYSSVLAVASGIPLPPFSALICPESWETYDFNATYIICCPK